MRCHQVCYVVATLLVASCDIAAAIATVAPYGLLAADRRRAAEQPATAPSGAEERPVDRATHIPETYARLSRNCYHRATDDGPLDDRSPVTGWPNETKRMRELEEIGWTDLPAEPYVKMPPKLALMMFASTKVNNEQIWLNWMERARSDGLALTMFIHSRDMGSVQEFQSKGLREYVQRSSVAIDWCNMWMAQMMLMRKALQDPTVSHLMVLSRDSIPVKPLRFIYQKLDADPATRMCADDNWRGKGGTPRAESWWLMRREDAELFTDNSLFARRNFLTHAEGCADEQAWYYPLKMREAAGNAVVRNECVMFADWADGTKACKDWMYTVGQCTTCGVLRSGPRTEADNAHPVTFQDVNRSALQGLVDSPFWFARKFDVGSVQLDAAELMLL